MCDDERIEPENLPQRIARLLPAAETTSGESDAVGMVQAENLSIREFSTGNITADPASTAETPTGKLTAVPASTAETSAGNLTSGSVSATEASTLDKSTGPAFVKRNSPEEQAVNFKATGSDRAVTESPITADLLIPGNEQEDLSLREKLRNYEAYLIHQALEASSGSMAVAARSLKVERSLLYKKMEKLGMK